MRLDRSISAGPRRGVEQTCTSIADFVTEVLDERAYPDAARVRAGFATISPTLRYLLTTRKLAEPAISVLMPELTIQISVSYDIDSEDNLEVPNLALLDKLPESAAIQVSLHSADEVPESLRGSLDKASSGQLTFTLGGGVPASSGEPDDGFDADPMPAKPAGDADIVDAKIVPPEEDSGSGDPVIGGY
jgi:hypothetical protein